MSDRKPFIGDPLPFERALELANHCAVSGGHSAIIINGNRWVRITHLRPDGPYGPHPMLPGFVMRGEVIDQRGGLIPRNGRANEQWRPFTGWTAEDRAALWSEVAHTHTNGRGGCASILCAQYGHAGGLTLVTG